MNVPRETVSKALFALVQSVQFDLGQGSQSWAFAEPTARIWSKVPASQQPYAGLYVPAEDAEESQAYGIAKWTLYYQLLVYVRRDAYPPAPDGSNVFGYLLDRIIDGVEQALYGPAGKGSPQTLYKFTNPNKNLVTQCSISGRIDRDEGLLDQQAKLEFPIRIITGI